MSLFGSGLVLRGFLAGPFPYRDHQVPCEVEQQQHSPNRIIFGPSGRRPRPGTVEGVVLDGEVCRFESIKKVDGPRS